MPPLHAVCVSTRQTGAVTSPPVRFVVLAFGVLAAACTTSSDAIVPGTATSDSAVAAVPASTDAMFERTTDVDNETSTTAAASTTTTEPPATTTASTTTTTSTTTSTTTTTTLAPGTVTAELDLSADSLVLGTSVEGREITAERYGAQGARRVLVIGVIHGNEDGGVPIVDDLRDRAIAGSLSSDVELWLVPSMNPDGQAAQDRHNANQVDLNRNFPLRWGPIGEPGDGQYAGSGPASEPETQAMVAFISELRPDLTLWYHQDANLIIPSSGRDGRVRARYAELSGLPVADCCSGGIYTGIAATWARDLLFGDEAAAFIVELPGGDLTAEQVLRHADTVAMIATELPEL